MQPSIATMQSEGTRPYLIFRRYQGAGFWSNFFCVVHSLDFADEQGFVPVVDMERYPTQYNEAGEEAAATLGTRNTWEYYFEQPGGLSLADALAARPLDNDGSAAPRIQLSVGAPQELAGMRRVRELIGKYIRVKPEILRQADAVLPPGLHPRILGVHVRGTDLRNAGHPGHPVPAPLLCYLETAQHLDREHGFERVYLASDELEALPAFRETFGPRLVTISAHRTSTSVETPRDYQWLFGHQRPLHRYHLGLEVLLDALLLARCGHLVCGLSNVASAAHAFSLENQVRHLVPPLWFTPARAHPSGGLESLTRFSGIRRSYSEVANQLIQDELKRLLALSEDATFAARQQANELQARFQKGPATLSQSIGGPLADLRKYASKLRRGARTMLKRIQRRVLKLVAH